MSESTLQFIINCFYYNLIDSLSKNAMHPKELPNDTAKRTGATLRVAYSNDS